MNSNDHFSTPEAHDFPKQTVYIPRSLKGLVLLFGFGAALAVTACGGDDTTGTGGSGGSNTGGGGKAGGGNGGSSMAGSMNNAGTDNTGGSGGSGGGAGGAGGAGGIGGAGGSMGGASGAGGAGGNMACNASPGKAMQFKSGMRDLIAGDIGTDFVGGNTARTLELWAKFIGAGSWTAEQSIIELGKPMGNNRVWGIDMSGRNGTAGVFGPYVNGVSDNNGTNAPSQLPNTPVDVGWLHLSWAYEGNGGKLEFTVDGNVIPTQVPAAGFMLNTTPGLVLLGASQNFGTNGWDGIMDEVRIWNVYRTPQQIKDNMRVFLKGTEMGLGAYYNFNDATGLDVADVTMKASRTLKPCTAAGGACPDANNAMPARVNSDIPGTFTCAP